MKNPTAILMSDVHIRETIPECRTDDFLATFKRKLNFVKDLQKKHNDIPVLFAGDLFHHWKNSPFLLSWALRSLPNDIIAIPGQHDLQAHSLENVDKSSIKVLEEAGKLTLLTNSSVISFSSKDIGISGFPWSIELGQASSLYPKNIALIHYLVYKGKEPFPGASEKGGTAKQIIKKMPGFDLIVSGDNHQTFVERVGNQLLVNPGSFMRTTAAQIDHKPCVFLWRASDNEIEQVFLPIEKNVISREHIDLENEKDERIESFVSRLKDNVEITLSFKSNLDRFVNKNKVREGVQKIIKRCLP